MPASPAVALPVTKIVEINSQNNLVTTNISGSYTGIAATQPSHGTTTVTGGTHLYYTPSPGYVGPDSFTYTASYPPRGRSDPAVVTILVITTTPVPILTDTFPTVLTNSSNNILPLDVANTATSYKITFEPSYGIATVLGQEIVYTPRHGYYGGDFLQYTASNSFGTSNVGTMQITVVPDVPVTLPTSQSIVFNASNTPINLNINGLYDTVYISTQATHGTATTSGSIISYTPNVGYQGADNFNYYVTNSAGSSNVSQVSLTVNIPIITTTPASGELPKGINNIPYTTITLNSSGGLAPYTYNLIKGSLPPGLTFNAGTISGTPTRPGVYYFTIATTDSNSPNHFTIYNDYILSVYATEHSTNFQWFTSAGLLFTATSGVTTSTIVEASDLYASYSLLAGSLPSGITLQSNGLISGTPAPVTNLERYKFSVRATIPTALTDNTFIIDVAPVGAPHWTYGTSPYELKDSNNNIFFNREYVNIALSATPPANAPPDYLITYSLASNYGSLPNNLTISSDGILSGIISTDTLPGVLDTYNFVVAAQLGNSVSTQTFIMNVENIYTDINQLVSPQFINPSFLGYFSDHENQYIPVTAYDPYPILGPIVYTTGTNTILPAGLQLDANTGILYGYVSTQTDYLISYPITIIATKTNPLSSAHVSVSNTFTMAIVHKDFDVINWITPADLGSTLVGAASNLRVEGTQTSNIYPLQYGINSGSLPLGLTLNPNGDIVGIPLTSGTFTATIIASPAPYGVGSITTNTTDFPFELNSRTFTITVLAGIPFINIVLKPLLSIEKRASYRDFFKDKSVFVPEMLYRPSDSNFGTQPELKMFLEYGIQELPTVADYAPIVAQNFYDRTFNYGNVNTLTALDNLGNPIYDVVYIELVDPNDGVKAQLYPKATGSDSTYYPSSIQNMRANLQSNNFINLDVAPLFVKTAKSNGMYPLNIVILCFALPGKGSKIVTRIKHSGFDFNQYEFYVDRFTIESTLATVTKEPAYIIFPKKTI
jgi:hypothetical protein